MSEYRLASGITLTDADIDQLYKEFESQSWAGRLTQIHHGPAAIAHELLVSVTVKFPQPMLENIDKRTKTAPITSVKLLQPPSKHEPQPILI